MKKLLFSTALVLVCSLSIAQNMLDSNSWTVGTGSVGEFDKSGLIHKNSRELGKNHLGEEVVLWKATPDADSDPDGGWNTDYYTIDATASYRFSVWIKKTNSNDGATFFGFSSYDNGIHYGLTLSDWLDPNPYFWHGDLPQLDTWYLLVGYVHKNGHSATTSLGGIYDGETGEKVLVTRDYKFENGATNLRHRAYLFYDNNTADRQYFYAPRIDPITGNEPTIHQLLNGNKFSKLVFSYDTAGNQTENFYCNDPSFCSTSAARKEHITASSAVDVQYLAEELPENSILDNHLHISPNPTSGLVVFSLGAHLLKNIHAIQLYSSNSVLVQTIAATSNHFEVDLSKLPIGLYFVHIHLRKGKSMTKKIVKY
jgi:hypothetical protein